MPKKIITACLVLLFFSCNSSVNEDIDDSKSREIKIDNRKLPDLSDISDIVNDIEIIPLKEKAGNLISDVFKIFKLNNNYIIYDGRGKINLFGETGNLIKTIIKVGPDPKDALQINDCWINNQKLEVYDFALKKIYQFDDNFDLKNTVKSEEFHIFKNIHALPKSDKYIGYAAFDERNVTKKKDKRFHIAYLDKNLHIEGTKLHYPQIFDGMHWLTFIQHFYPYNDSLRFAQCYDNNIYDVSNNQISKKFNLAYKDNPMPEDFMNKIVKKNLSAYQNRSGPPSQWTKFLRGYSFFSGVWLESKDYIYFSSSGTNSYFYTFVKKGKYNTANIGKDFIETKRFKLKLPPFQYYDSETNSFIAGVSGFNLKGYLHKTSKFNEIVSDDPETFYIVLVKLKRS